MRVLVRAVVLSVLALAACGDDGPSGPSADFDIVGAWQWSVQNAAGDGFSCNVTNVTLTFTRTDGVLSGTRFSPGGGNIACTTPSGTTNANFTTNTAIQNLAHSGTSISFDFTSTTGTWEMAGSVVNDNRMTGSATIRLATSVGNVTLTGPWTATRN